MASVARYCCCGVGCASEYEATVSGIDGNICCVTNETVTATSFNGVVTASFLSEPIPGELCVFEYVYGITTFTAYSDACVTPTGSTRTKTVRLRVGYNLITSKITTVTIADNTGGQDIFFDSGSGSWNLGDTISNNLTCGNVFGIKSWCQVGSVVIDNP
jgi:hypothetical protein